MKFHKSDDLKIYTSHMHTLVILGLPDIDLTSGVHLFWVRSALKKGVTDGLNVCRILPNIPKTLNQILGFRNIKNRLVLVLTYYI